MAKLRINDEIAKLVPAELICNEAFFISGIDVTALREKLNISLSAVDSSYFDPEKSEKVLVDSSGCNTWGGGRMSRRACGILDENKIPFDTHISKQFTAQEYKKFKHVIALDKEIFTGCKALLQELFGV